jgi:hypothetical protein
MKPGTKGIHQIDTKMHREEKVNDVVQKKPKRKKK